MNTYNMDKMYESYASGMETMQMWLDESEQENKQLKDKIDKAIEYIEKCLKQTPTENRTKTDDTLDIEYEYILKILKEVK